MNERIRGQRAPGDPPPSVPLPPPPPPPAISSLSDAVAAHEYGRRRAELDAQRVVNRHYRECDGATGGRCDTPDQCAGFAAEHEALRAFRREREERLGAIGAAGKLATVAGLSVAQEIRARALDSASGVYIGAAIGPRAGDLTDAVLVMAERFAAYIADGGFDEHDGDDDPLDVVVTIPIEELIERGCRENPEFSAAVERTRAEFAEWATRQAEPSTQEQP